MCEGAGAAVREGKGEELISSKSGGNMFNTCSGHILKLQITSTTHEPTSGSRGDAQGKHYKIRRPPT